MDVTTIIQTLETTDRVTGLTHDFYRYPARFSPIPVRELILQLTAPGDIVLDPFMGGGTTVVESLALGRLGLGTDISTFSAFLTRTKTTLLTEQELSNISRWGQRAIRCMSPRKDVRRESDWAEVDYQKALPWRIRKMLEQGIYSAQRLPQKEQAFARCALLRTAQWALDCKRLIPTASSIRQRLAKSLAVMIEGMRSLTSAVESLGPGNRVFAPHILTMRAEDITSSTFAIPKRRRPKLVITSPPYPGVHVLYHRWQVQSRRETPAQFWLANCRDGHGGAYYTFGDRKRTDHYYFTQLTKSFQAIRHVIDPNGTVAQIVGFNDPTLQLPLYLAAMEMAGFQQLPFTQEQSHIWRTVPNRRWYTYLQTSNSASSEVLLLHRPA